MKKAILTVLLISAFAMAKAQKPTHYTERDYARSPVWITMMQDTLSNYFEVEKAFNTYFQHHIKPEGEEAEINEYREREKTVSKRRRRKIEAENSLRMDVKRYELWHEKMLPYVQDDGHILTPAERLKIWREQSGAQK